MHCILFNLITQLKIFLRRAPLFEISFKAILKISLREDKENLSPLV